MFKCPAVSLLSLFLLFGSLALAASTPVGEWRTIDDETGVTKSIVEIYVAPDGSLEGRVVKVLQSDQGPNPICKNCPGERKDQPIEGMVILWGMESQGDHWAGGKILDPKKGKTYKCKLTLAEDGSLEVRGFIGFSLIGRTQTWLPNEPAAAG